MSCKELQEEELEVLQSIYDGDSAFNEVNPTTFQYKIGEDQHPKSFLLEINWGENYPDELPNINLNAFYNKHVISEVKEYVVSKLMEEAEAMLSQAMTYTLFEYAKEQADELVANQPEHFTQGSSESSCKEPQQQQKAKPKERKEQLTKAQKRKIVNRMDNKGELPRGWDWVDVVKHLSQTGSAHKNETS